MILTEGNAQMTFQEAMQMQAVDIRKLWQRKQRRHSALKERLDVGRFAIAHYRLLSRFLPKSKPRRLSDSDIELRPKELQAVGLFTCLCFLGAVIDLILNLSFSQPSAWCSYPRREARCAIPGLLF
jgi:hypothetical protein